MTLAVKVALNLKPTNQPNKPFENTVGKGEIARNEQLQPLGHESDMRTIEPPGQGLAHENSKVDTCPWESNSRP